MDVLIFFSLKISEDLLKRRVFLRKKRNGLVWIWILVHYVVFWHQATKQRGEGSKCSLPEEPPVNLSFKGSFFSCSQTVRSKGKELSHPFHLSFCSPSFY